MFKTPFSLPCDENVFFILDGSAIDEVGTHIYSLDTQAEAYALFSQTAHESLLPVSPWIVRYTEQSAALFHWVSQQGYFQQGAWLCQSPYDMMQLVAHFQSLMLVDNGGQETFFRFADPRVMYALTKDHVQRQNFAITAPFSVMWFRGTSDWLSVELALTREPSLKKYRVSDRDIEIFTAVSKERMVEQLSAHIKTHYPLWQTRNAHMSSKQVVDEAEGYGITTEKGVYLYAYLLGSVGHQALADNQYPNITACLRLPSVYTAEQRVEQAALIAKQLDKGIMS
ncbi:DUF4123 domain-containing protein [Photobacterium leiognathi]|uniref:DUF4123 domain-containing protein n=1 Tax=Photobacterium leiognathi TaxID=553611 RepID=UPI002980C0A2|nr:DUF4123 domain-containing protein [Photobacterium leiognathi]